MKLKKEGVHILWNCKWRSTYTMKL